MKIGLTYDLRSEYLAAGYGELETAEFDRDDTIQAIADALSMLGHSTERIGNARQLIECLAAGRRWDMVFNIAEGLYGIGREAQVPAILDVYGLTYTFSDPLVMCLTLHKGMTKRVVRDAGIPTSDFTVVQTPSDLQTLTFEPPYFIKPVAEGTGKGVTPDCIIQNRSDLSRACSAMQAAFGQPVLVERYLAGREFTVALAGDGLETEVLGTIEVHLLAEAEAGVYSYVNKEHCEELVEYRLLRADNDPAAAEAERVAVRAWQTLGCRDAGRVDIRCDDGGQPQFLEVNPLAGLHPEHSDLPIICRHAGIPYLGLIERIVTSASQRINAHANRHRS
jgi:D-alanine-D-alanine ligase